MFYFHLNIKSYVYSIHNFACYRAYLCEENEYNICVSLMVQRKIENGGRSAGDSI